MEIDRKITFLCPFRYVFEASEHFKVGRVFFKAMSSAKTQWGVMSTFWHKMSNLKPVCSIKMWNWPKITFLCPFPYVLMLVSILKLEGLHQRMSSTKTQWGVMSTFWHKMSNLKPVCSVNFHILIEQTGFRFDILCQKVDITPHCVFALDIALKKTFQL